MGTSLAEPQGRARGAAAWEISFVISCVLIAEWAILPFFGRNMLIGMIPVGVCFIFMFWSHRAWGEKARDLGWRIDNFPQSLSLLAAPMLLAGVLLIVVGWLTEGSGTGVRDWRLVLLSFPWLFLWGLMQQYALQAFINRRAQVIWGRGTSSVLFVALVFGLLHLPNLWLMLATFTAGILWSYVYQRTPNLLALALSHSLLTVVLISTAPAAALHGMRVGFNYYWPIHPTS